MAGGAQSSGGGGGETEDNEVLHHSSERFRMKLIRDFRLLENLTEMEAGLEAPKYHAQDVQDEKKRMKLLTDNPNALVKFHNVTPRVDNPKYEHLNETQRKRLHKIKYRLAAYHPPRDYIANNIVESKFFKRMINCIIYINLFTVLFQTSITTEFKRLSKADPTIESVPVDTSYVFFDNDKYPTGTSNEFYYWTPPEVKDQTLKLDRSDCSVTYFDIDGESIITKFLNKSVDLPDGQKIPSDDFDTCKQSEDLKWHQKLYTWTSSVKPECKPFFERFREDIVYNQVNNMLSTFEYVIMAIFILEVILYWIDDFKAYWQSGTRIFDFVVTILCILPIIFDQLMEQEILKQDVSKLITTGGACPFVQWENTLIDMDKRYTSTSEPGEDVLLYTIIKQLTTGEKQFIGPTRERFCYVMDDTGNTETPSYNYFCNVSSTKRISSLVFFSYQFFLALRVCRIFKITFGDPKVRAIVVSIRKAFKSMVVIFFLLFISVLLFSLFIYTMFSDTGEDSGVEYTMEHLISMYQGEGTFDARNGFGGFISFSWTFSILCQLMTLDRWKGVIDQVFYDTFNETQYCELHTFERIGGWLLPASGNPDDRESGKFLTWVLIFLFLLSWVWAGNFVFKNLITGIVVNNFLAYSNEVRWGENEANVERELKNIADEIEEEVKRVELVPGTTMAMGMSGAMSDESIITEEDSLDLDETLIEQYEKQADFWRENYYKPWRYPFMTRLFPNLSSKIEQLSYRMNRHSVRVENSDDDLGLMGSTNGSADTMDMLDKAIRRSSFKSATPSGSQNLRPDDENLRRISTHMLENHGLNVNTPNSNMRRGSCLSVANEINMNAIARNLHNLRTNAGSMDSSSSDSESDIEDDNNEGRRMGDRRKSTQSLLSSYSHRYTTTNQRKNSARNEENDTAEFDMTQWELAIQMHMDKVKGFPKESLWPRDVLFKYYQLMERIQENLQERQEIIRLFSQCMLNDHDI